MGGIYTCLKRSSNDLNVVLSYDLPLVNEGLVSYLIQERGSHDIILPSLQKNKLEPLCGIYRKKVAGTLKSLMNKNEFAVHRAFQLVKSKTILINSRMPFWHPDLFLNINHIDDLKRLPAGFGDELDES